LKKILFITGHRKDRAPNQRFRFEQYLDYLNTHGFECTVSPLIANVAEDKLFYSRGNYLKKLPLGALLALRRVRDVVRSGRYDIVFIAREAFITGSVFFEKLLSLKNTKIIFDFDDAIWMDVVSVNNKKFSWLKDGNKTANIIRLSDLVIAGNAYLAEYAEKFNSNVHIIPTTIDTQKYQPAYRTNKQSITIGWSGSVSTIEHFQHAVPALKAIKEKYREKVQFKVVGDANFRDDALQIKGEPWRSETEIANLQAMDIGIMPLPNDEWTKGKCGLKGLQYMALEIPTVMSAVGVNKEIIQDGENGFLAEHTDEWVNKISRLVDDEQLRLRVGKAGRDTVVKAYSVISQEEKYLKIFQSILHQERP
jgi:glycosyltransferase involved in cell wall biosynthesis